MMRVHEWKVWDIGPWASATFGTDFCLLDIVNRPVSPYEIAEKVLGLISLCFIPFCTFVL